MGNRWEMKIIMFEIIKELERIEDILDFVEEKSRVFEYIVYRLLNKKEKRSNYS